jgi:hypothetical protein
MAYKRPTKAGLYWLKYFPMATDGYRSDSDLEDVQPVMLVINKSTDLDYELKNLEFKCGLSDDASTFSVSLDEVAWTGPIEVEFSERSVKTLHRQQLDHFHEYKVTKCSCCNDIREVESKRAARYSFSGDWDGSKGKCKACGKTWALELMYRANVENWKREQQAKVRHWENEAHGKRLKLIADKAREIEAELFPDRTTAPSQEQLMEFSRRLNEFKAGLP